MINFKEHLKLTSVYTFFAAFPAILQLIVYPLIEGPDRLNAEDFGYLAITEAILSFMAMFCLFGSSMAISRFYYDYTDDSKNYNKLVSTIFNSVLLRSALVLGLVLILSPFVGNLFPQKELRDFGSYGPYLAIIAFNRTVIAVALALHRSDKNVKRFVYVALFSGLSRSAFQLIGVYYLEISFKGYIIGTAIGGGIISLSIMLVTWKRHGIHLSKFLRKKLLDFSHSLFYNDIIFWGIMFIDRFFLLKDPVSLGIYDNAMKFAIGVQLIGQGLAGSIQPELFRLFKKGFKQNENEIKTLSHLFVGETMAIIAFSIIPLSLFIEYFYETELKLSAGIIALVLMRFVLNAVFQIYLWPLIYLKKTKVFYRVNSVVLLIMVALNYLLVPKFGYYGSIISLLVAGVFQVAVFNYYQDKTVHIAWNKNKLFYFPLISIAFIGVIEILFQHLEIHYLYKHSVVVLFIFSGLLFFYKNELLRIISKHVLSRF